MIHQFYTDSSLLFLEAMFSCSSAWHTVKYRLHYTINSLERCTSKKHDVFLNSNVSRVRVRAHISSSNWSSELNFFRIVYQYIPMNVKGVRHFSDKPDVVNWLWRCGYRALGTIVFFRKTQLPLTKMMQHGSASHRCVVLWIDTEIHECKLRATAGMGDICVDLSITFPLL